MKILEYNPQNCIGCLSCVRNCPVKAIAYDNQTGLVNINFNRCVGCGICIGLCASNAIQPIDSKQEVKTILQTNENVVAICDPSISGEFVDISDYRKFVQMIRKLGFSYVHEASFGADIIAIKYNELLQKYKGKYFIFANCPSVMSLIEKYNTELLPNIAPLISPAFATAKIVRHKYGNDIKVVYITSCLSIKHDIKQEENAGLIDSALTFVELRDMFNEDGIVESSFEYSDFDYPVGYKGSIFPVMRGFIETMGCNTSVLSGETATISGYTDVKEITKIFKDNISYLNHHFDTYFCQGCCIMGKGTTPNGEKFVRKAAVVKYANKRLADFNIDQWSKDIDTYSQLDFSRNFINDNQILPLPDSKKIQEVLTQLGVNRKNKNTGCGACGFNSCKDFAISVAKGISTPYSCLTYSMKQQNDYIHNLQNINQKLSQTETALKESESKATREKIELENSQEIINNLMQKLPLGIIIIDNNLKIVYANHTFAQLMGDDIVEIEEVIPGLKGADLSSIIPNDIMTSFKYVSQSAQPVNDKDIQINDTPLLISIFPIKRKDMIGAFIRDVENPIVQKEQIIDRINKAIDENMRMVQEIGFLLGEGASNTERTLNSIIKNYINNDNTKQNA